MQTKALALALAGGIGMFALVNSVLAQGWIATSAPVTNWFALAASADGATVMAAINRDPYQSGNGGPIYLSTDSGTNWTLASAPVTNWIAVASSADGTKLIAAVAVPPNSSPSGSTIYLSTNSGTSWIVSSAPVTNWVAVASSADGTVLVAAHAGVAQYALPGLVYTSTNAGLNWRTSGLPSLNWSSVASSADGAKLVAAGSNAFNVIFTSTNSGISWISTSAPSYEWNAVASSADGTRLVALARYHGVYLSTNSGATWTQTTVPSGYGSRIASSADGRRLAVTSQLIYLSTNSGATWFDSGAPSTNWASIAFSADGCRAIAAAQGGGIYTRQIIPTPTLAAALAGTNLVLSWTIPSVAFGLEESSNLASPTWADVRTPPKATNVEQQVVVSPGNGSNFYRLRLSGPTRSSQGMLPEMGLNTFVSYGSHLTEAIVKAGIDGIITNGYRDAGYVTYVIDDGWTYPCPSNVDAFFTSELGHAGRAADGTILVDTNRFPGATGTDTLKYLVDYIHTRGLKAGIYMDAGPACTSGGMTGSGGHEQQDINTVASWGVDSIKFDQGGVDQDYYARLNQYCLDSGRKMYLQSGAGGVGRPFGTWIPDYLNAWRPVPYFPDDPTGPENGDMHPPWTNFMAHVDSFIRDARFIGPGHVPDGDDAATAPGDPQCVRAIMTMWAMYSVTMHLTGSQPTSYEKEWLTNSEVIAIDQDAAVLPATIISSNLGMMVFSKPLGSPAPLSPKAVAFLNRNFAGGPLTATVNFTNIGFPNGVATVRDVFQRCVMGYYTNSFTCPAVGPTNASIYKLISGVQPPFRYGTNYLGDDDVWYLAAGLTNNGVQYYGAFWTPPRKNLTVTGAGLTNNGKSYSRGLQILPGNGTVAQLSYFLGGGGSQLVSRGSGAG